MAISLGSGFPVAFALPGSAIISIGVAAFFGYLLENNPDAYFFSGGPSEWLSAGVTNIMADIPSVNILNPYMDSMKNKYKIKI